MSNIRAPEESLAPSTDAYEGYRKKEKKKNKIEHKRAIKYSEKQIRGHGHSAGQTARAEKNQNSERL